MKKASAGCSRGTLRNWPGKHWKQNATPSSPYATKKPSTTRCCAESNAILIWPKPGFSGPRENRGDYLRLVLLSLTCLDARPHFLPSSQLYRPARIHRIRHDDRSKTIRPLSPSILASAG